MKFSRECPVCKRKVSGANLRPRQAREMAHAFAAAHLGHFLEARSGRPYYRCAADGTLLLFDWQCPEHGLTAEKVRWDDEMAEAYRSVVESMAGGVHVAVRPNAMFLVQRAYGLAKAWGMRKDVWLRESVA